MHIRPAVASDLSAIATLSVPGCWDDELVEWLYPRRAQYPEYFRDSFLQEYRMRYWSSDYIFYVAETDKEDKDWSGEPQVTGYAIWQRRGNDGAAKAWQKRSWRARIDTALLKCEAWYHDLLKADKSMDYARAGQFKASSPDAFEDISDMWKLRNLCSDPAFQRRGVGGMLVEWGQKQASLEGCPVVLTASIVGEQLYRKKGFRAYGIVPCEGFMDIPMFIWEPPGMEGWWGTKDDGKAKGQPEGKHAEDAF